MVPHVGLTKDDLSKLRKSGFFELVFVEEFKLPFLAALLAQVKKVKKRTPEVALHHGEPEAVDPAIHESLLLEVVGFPVAGERTCFAKISCLVVTVG
jgi:hypothetical protein